MGLCPVPSYFLFLFYTIDDLIFEIYWSKGGPGLGSKLAVS